MIRRTARHIARAVSAGVRWTVGLFDDVRSVHVYAGIGLAATGLTALLDWSVGAVFAGIALIWIGTRSWASSHD